MQIAYIICLVYKRAMDKNKLIIVRGGGDLATGIIHRLWSCGFKVLVLETPAPRAIRRQVSVCEVVFSNETEIEGMKAELVSGLDKIQKALDKGNVPVLIDPDGDSIKHFKPDILIDATAAKRNLGTTKSMAPITIALGPGFEAGIDVDYVIETQRGHNLGRILEFGSAQKNSGIPGNIDGYTTERVVRAPVEGEFIALKKIGDVVGKNEKIAEIVAGDGTIADVVTEISGVLRGLLNSGYYVTKGFKSADVDPRVDELENCFTISDKARCIAGSVLELCVRAFNT